MVIDGAILKIATGCHCGYLVYVRTRDIAGKLYLFAALVARAKRAVLTLLNMLGASIAQLLLSKGLTF